MCKLIFNFVSAQVKVFVEGLFYLNKNVASFKEHLRDFLVQIKVTARFIALHVRKFVCIVGVHWR